MVSKEQIEQAKREIEIEDEERLKRARSPEIEAIVAENHRRSDLPSEHPDHIHGMFCDGQDGATSYCMRLRRKLGFK